MIHKIFAKIGYTQTIHYTQATHKIEKQRQELVKRSKELETQKNNTNKLESFKLKYTDTASELNELKTKNKLPSKTQLGNWSKNVRKTGKCDCCGHRKKQDDLSAHHLWPKNLFPTLANRSANGVALCNKCHNGYHKKYPNNENCNPNTYQEFKTDEINKVRLTVLEEEVKALKSNNVISKVTHRFKQALSQVTV